MFENMGRDKDVIVKFTLQMVTGGNSRHQVIHLNDRGELQVAAYQRRNKNSHLFPAFLGTSLGFNWKEKPGLSAVLSIKIGEATVSTSVRSIVKQPSTAQKMTLNARFRNSKRLPAVPSTIGRARVWLTSILLPHGS